MKECYYYLDSTPTHSYMKALYKYPQKEYPYVKLVNENKQRTKEDREFELADTGKNEKISSIISWVTNYSLILARNFSVNL